MSQGPPPPTRKELARIAQILLRRGSAWASILEEADDTIRLSDEDIDSITDQLLDEFLATLDDEMEPDRYGAEVDDLIGILQGLRSSFNRTDT